MNIEVIKQIIEALDDLTLGLISEAEAQHYAGELLEFEAHHSRVALWCLELAESRSFERLREQLTGALTRAYEG